MTHFQVEWERKPVDSELFLEVFSQDAESQEDELFLKSHVSVGKLIVLGGEREEEEEEEEEGKASKYSSSKTASQ